MPIAHAPLQTDPQHADPLARLGPWPWAAAATLVSLLTAWRVLGLWLAQTDLYTDEAQYWFWSETPALGYFSKPPLIAWVIRLATELGGSETPFWVRLPAPLFHAATAFLIGALGAWMWGRRIGALSAIFYATMPAVTVGSMVISTDTLLLPFFASGLLAWLWGLARPGAAPAVALGLAIGCGVYAKYAMLYLPLCMALAAVAAPSLRLRRDVVGVAAVVALLVALPHLVWSAGMGFVTAAHVAADAQAGAGGLDFKEFGEFLGAQFGVFGPILIPAWAVACWRVARGGGPAGAGALVWSSAPIVAIIAVQALRAGAEANWAAAAYAGATPLAAYALARAPRLLAASLGLHLLVAVVAPLLPIAPSLLAGPDGRPVLNRLIGRVDLAERFAALARAEGVDVIVADNRGLLSDLLYTERLARRAGELAIYAPPPAGAPSNHFEMTIPAPRALDRPALYLTGREAPMLPGLTPAARVETITPDSGFFKGRTVFVWRMEPAP
jgi:4-amino-4-deoxy-L-arabinose transferase-like glycosyltransferase